jgi:hypothetical protein
MGLAAHATGRKDLCIEKGIEQRRFASAGSLIGCQLLNIDTAPWHLPPHTATTVVGVP